MFGGPKGSFQNNRDYSLHLEAPVLRDLWQEEKIDLWISRFQSVIPEALNTIANTLMTDWYKGDLAELIRTLADRLAQTTMIT